MQLRNQKNIMDEYKAIMASDIPEVDKVRDAFKLVTDMIIAQGELEIEALRAMNDRENLIKEQIKVSTVRSVTGIFAEAYRLATGRRAGGAQDER